MRTKTRWITGSFSSVMYPGGGDSVIGKAALSGTETASSSRLGRIGGSRGIWKTERDGIVQAGVEREDFSGFRGSRQIRMFRKIHPTPKKDSYLLPRFFTAVCLREISLTDQ